MTDNPTLAERIETVGSPEREGYHEGHSEGYQSGYRDGRVTSVRLIVNTLRHDQASRLIILADLVETFGPANGIRAAHAELVDMIEKHGRNVR